MLMNPSTPTPTVLPGRAAVRVQSATSARAVPSDQDDARVLRRCAVLLYAGLAGLMTFAGAVMQLIAGERDAGLFALLIASAATAALCWRAARGVLGRAVPPFAGHVPP